MTRTCGVCDAFMRYSGECTIKGIKVDPKTEIRVLTDTGEWNCIRYPRNENPCRTCDRGAFCREWPYSLRCEKERRPMLDMDKIAKGLGAERRGKVPKPGGGYFGAMQTATERVTRRYSRHVPTPDDWYPTWANGTAKGSVIQNPPWRGTILVRMCFWGADDFGLEKDFLFAEEDSFGATQRFESLKRQLDGMAIVTQEALREMGFVNA